MFFGNVCGSGLFPALMRPSLPAALAINTFHPLPVDAASALRLLSGFNAMDPVQKAVLGHALGHAPTANRKHASCSVCQLRFNSQSQASAHFKGTRHAKKLKALDAPRCQLKCSPAVAKETASSVNTSPVPDGAQRKDGASSPVLRLAPPPTPPSAPATPTPPHDVASAPVAETISTVRGEEGPTELRSPPEPDPDPESERELERETEEGKARRLLYCSLCKVAVNSASQLEAHNSGTKHRTMLDARSGVGSIKSFPRAGVKPSTSGTGTGTGTGLQNRTFHCQTCDVHVNSETQLKQHISSRRHKDRAAGKPAKPKYSPYSKTSKGSSKQLGKLLLAEGRSTLTPPMLPAHLAAVAAAAIGHSLGHRKSHGPAHSHGSALFQTQPLPPALLHPAPGPIRTSHPQVLFTPY